MISIRAEIPNCSGRGRPRGRRMMSARITWAEAVGPGMRWPWNMKRRADVRGTAEADEGQDPVVVRESKESDEEEQP